jgi:hypothetical protein
MYSKFWLENFKGRDHSGDEGADERLILKWILEKEGMDQNQLTKDRILW